MSAQKNFSALNFWDDGQKLALRSRPPFEAEHVAHPREHVAFVRDHVARNVSAVHTPRVRFTAKHIFRALEAYFDAKRRAQVMVREPHKTSRNLGIEPLKEPLVAVQDVDGKSCGWRLDGQFKYEIVVLEANFAPPSPDFIVCVEKNWLDAPESRSWI
jgi:hypothetical protein